jgi:transposase
VNHVAIDLGSRESQVCVRQADGTVVLEKKHPTRRLGELMSSWPPSRVILETSSEAFRVADAARAAGHEVRVVPATLAKQLGVGDRGIKTDARDARQLSQVSCRIDLPSVHIPSEAARALRSLVRSRELLIETRTKSVNHVRGWLRAQLWKLRSGTTGTLPQRVRTHATANALVVPEHVERVLLVIDTLNGQVKEADRQVRTLSRENPVCRRLMTIPGVGPVTAVSYVAAIDDVSRFRHAHLVQSYLGLTPGEHSSSERQSRLSITKAGPTSVRRTLIQAAWAVFRRRPNEPMVCWATQIAERRGRFIAIVALARKLAGIMYAVWRDDTSYQASKAAHPSMTEVPTR